MCIRDRDKGYDAFIHNRAVDLSLLFVQKLFREGRMEIFSNSGTTLLHAVDYIREHFTEDIGVHDVAVHIGLNSNYFSHYFKCSDVYKRQDFAGPVNSMWLTPRMFSFSGCTTVNCSLM